ncbi:hypothetical protein ABTE84_21770, partial [Acinetobacter baumannii]
GSTKQDADNRAKLQWAALDQYHCRVRQSDGRPARLCSRQRMPYLLRSTKQYETQQQLGWRQPWGCRREGQNHRLSD